MPVLHVTKQGSGKDAKIEVVEDDNVQPWPSDAHFEVVGTAPSRLEGREKVSGRAQYSYDVRLPGQLYARVLRSTRGSRELTPQWPSASPASTPC